MASDAKTENLAKKLAQSNNQKCNFKYLMNSKTNRSFKASLPSKQNQIQSVIMSSAHKLANKTSEKAKYDSVIIDSTRIPLCLQSAIVTNRDKSQESLKLQNDKYQKYDSINLEIYSKLKTNVSQRELQSTASMTDECYYEKQLLLKIELLKKQRDDIWNSISDTVKQNIQLKQIIAQFTIDSKSKQTVLIQTELVQLIEVEIQTDLEGRTIDVQNQKYLKSKKYLQQAEYLCLKMLPKDSQYNNIALKDLLLETLNINFNTLSKQFEKQKQFLVTFHDQQFEELKKITEKLRLEIYQTNCKLKESGRLNENMKRIYEKQIREIRSFVQNKQISFINEIVQIKQDWQDIIKKSELKNKFYLDYFQNIKYCFKEKQTIYSTLLSESHKTISNLMTQLKQFQAMANSNYYKHLRSQRSQRSFEKIIKKLE